MLYDYPSLHRPPPSLVVGQKCVMPLTGLAKRMPLLNLTIRVLIYLKILCGFEQKHKNFNAKQND